MDDLVAFLRARLDEDAEVAQAAPEGPWAVGEEDGLGHWKIVGRFATSSRYDPVGDANEYAVYRVPVAGPGLDGGGVCGLPAAAHIARHDPARVLADIEAKRALLTAVVSARHDYDHWHARPPADSEERAKVLAGMTARWSAWQFVLVQLAKLYVDHPGFREEWRQLV